MESVHSAGIAFDLPVANQSVGRTERMFDEPPHSIARQRDKVAPSLSYPRQILSTSLSNRLVLQASVRCQNYITA